MRGALVAAVVAAALAVVLLLARGQPAAQAGYVTAAESWVLPRLDRPGVAHLADFRGRPVVVDFFATWCTACRDELPELAAVSHRAGAAVAFVGVDSEENGDGLSMARRYGISAWTLVRDTGGSQQSGLRDSVEPTPGMPVIALYDSHGKLVLARLGAVTGDTLVELLRQHLGVTVAA